VDRPLNQGNILPEVKGIFPSDILIRHALIEGFKDLRANPWQLQLVYAGIVSDELTANQYGDKSRQRAVDWFLKTDIPIIPNFKLDNKTFPSVSCFLGEMTEVNNTLADMHYNVKQDVVSEQEPITSKFTPEYNVNTGVVIIPEGIITPNTQMVLVDGIGKGWVILEVLDEHSFRIEPRIITNFSGSYIRWTMPKLSADLGSVDFRETIKVGCHTGGDPEIMLWLYPVVLYSLLRYRKDWLEGRGFAQSTLSVTSIINESDQFGTENVWSRYINVIGFHRNYWASLINGRVLSTQFAAPSTTLNAEDGGLRFSPTNTLATGFTKDPAQDDPSWMASDGIGIKL